MNGSRNISSELSNILNQFRISSELIRNGFSKKRICVASPRLCLHVPSNSSRCYLTSTHINIHVHPPNTVIILMLRPNSFTHFRSIFSLGWGQARPVFVSILGMPYCRDCLCHCWLWHCSCMRLGSCVQ